METQNHNLQKVVEAMVVPNESPEVKERLSRLMITSEFDLRGISSKTDTLRSTPLCSGWMVFLNKARTLAHIMHAEDINDETYIRMKVPCKVKGAHPEFLRRYFYNRMVSRYII
jgi:hypothetical protein